MTNALFPPEPPAAAPCPYEAVILPPRDADAATPLHPVHGRPWLRYVLDALTAQGVERIILAMEGQNAVRALFRDAYRGARLVYLPAGTNTADALPHGLALCRHARCLLLEADTLPALPLLSEAAPTDRPLHVLHNATTDAWLVQADTACARHLAAAGVAELPALARHAAGEAGDGCLGSLAADALLRYAPATAARVTAHLPPVVAGKAVFFDRDGTINEDTGYVYRLEDMRFIQGMPEFLRLWRQWGYKVLVVTNQSGIARGMYTEEDMHALHAHMNAALAASGAHIDAFYFCPHHPDITGECQCRKPAPGLLERALWEFDLDAGQCLLFGDAERDIAAARAAGICGIRTVPPPRR